MSLMPNDVLSISSYIIDHLHISFGQMYIQIYCPFCKVVMFAFVLLICKSSVYINILDTGPYQIYD